MTELIHGDCLEVLRSMPDCSVDAVVTDPPYGLSFMGKKWDYDVPGVEVWAECLRVLKPGGHLLAFAGTRTQHRMAVRIEDAGFEIRDMIAWVYGCLSEDTEILTKNGWEQYRISKNNSIFADKEILIYDPENDIYKWEKPKRWSEYNIHKDTAYRIKSNTTDQIVSRNHRCLVEREGKLIFVKAEELDKMEFVPTLQGDIFSKVEGKGSFLQSSMQWSGKGSGMEKTSSQGEGQLETRERTGFKGKNDWKQKLGMERWSNLFQKKREICRPIYKICEVSKFIFEYGKKRWLCNGTQIESSARNTKAPNKVGMRTPYQSRCNGQQNREFDAIQDERRTQEIRERKSYNTTLATVEPFEYSGIIFCPTVSTSAFVARRNGKIFITGNSGFPKSLDVSKAIDKAAGAEREVVASYKVPNIKGDAYGTMNEKQGGSYETATHNITAPATDAAKQWQGWGTALKPSWESITVAQKPIQSSSDVEFFFVSLLHTLKTELCQYQSFALIAEKHLMSSRSESGEVLSIAQWTAEKSTNIQADLSDLMGMLQLGLETNINWSTVSSWLNTLGALYKAMNTCTIETASSLTIELKTLNLLEWASILQSIMQSNGTSQNGQSANVCTAEILFSALELKLRTIQILSVIDTATLRGSDGGFAPNLDPIVVARKPLIGTVAENVLKHGTGAINVDGGRVGKREKEQFIGAKSGTVNSYGNYFYEKSKTPLPDGRWPANFIHDGSEEVVGLFPMTKSGKIMPQHKRTTNGSPNGIYGKFDKEHPFPETYGDSGSAARFFYCAKASKADRGENNYHITVKPTDLMRYLCRLVTPPNGVVLDPFMGSGSTGKAAALEGFSFIGIEREAEYVAIAQARINHVTND